MVRIFSAAGLLSPAVLAAAAQPGETFTVNLAGATLPFDASVQTKCVGSSHASTALRADWREQLTKVRREIGAEFVRFHGLFDDDMSVVINGQGKTEQAATQGGSGNCTFVANQDFGDAAGPVFEVNSQEECCDACYNRPTGLPEPCIAAVFAPWGKCYTKLASNQPRQTDSGVLSCVTDRQGPRGYHYSWVNIFSVFDFLRAIDMRPIVELGFMPRLLASDPSHTVFWYKGGISPPKSWDEWRDFMAAFTTALIDRYGADEVHKWHFEVWNEPNCGFYVAGGCCGPTCGHKSEYLDLFTNTFEAIKSVDPQVQVGGPATAQLGWVAEFVTNASAANCPPDFVTTHLYPTDPFIEHHRDGFGNAVSDAADAIAAAATAAGAATVPKMFLTEYNCGLGIECADAPFAGSFVAHNMLRSQEILEAVPMQSYWTFSDIFEEQGQQASEFSQAFGMQSVNGVPKPIYRVLQLLGRLHGMSVAVSPIAAAGNSSIDVIVTKEGNSIEVMVASHPSMSSSTRAINLAHISGQSSEEDGVEVTLLFEGVSSLDEFPVDKVELRRVDADNSNALKLWKQSGSPDYPDAALLASLQAASDVRITHLAATMQGDSLTVKVTMPAYSVASISLNLHPPLTLV